MHDQHLCAVVVHAHGLDRHVRPGTSVSGRPDRALDAGHLIGRQVHLAQLVVWGEAQQGALDGPEALPRRDPDDGVAGRQAQVIPSGRVRAGGAQRLTVAHGLHAHVRLRPTGVRAGDPARDARHFRQARCQVEISQPARVGELDGPGAPGHPRVEGVPVLVDKRHVEGQSQAGTQACVRGEVQAPLVAQRPPAPLHSDPCVVDGACAEGRQGRACMTPLDGLGRCRCVAQRHVDLAGVLRGPAVLVAIGPRVATDDQGVVLRLHGHVERVLPLRIADGEVGLQIRRAEGRAAVPDRGDGVARQAVGPVRQVAIDGDACHWHGDGHGAVLWPGRPRQAETEEQSEVDATAAGPPRAARAHGDLRTGPIRPSTSAAVPLPSGTELWQPHPVPPASCRLQDPM